MIRAFTKLKIMQDSIVKMYDTENVLYGSLPMAVIVNMNINTEYLYNLMINRLAMLGYDMDVEDCYGVTPLAKVIMKCNIGTINQVPYIYTIKKLISCGADVTKIKPEVLFTLINAYGQTRWVHNLSRLILLLLIRNGANYQIPNVNNSDPLKASLLHKAIKCGDVELVDLLCGVGCKVNIKDNIGKTPLHYLFESEYIEKGSLESEAKLYILADLLLVSGADFNCEDKSCITPALELVFADHLDAIIKYRKHIKFGFGKNPVIRYMTIECKEALLRDELKQEVLKRRVIAKITQYIREQQTIEQDSIMDGALLRGSRAVLSRQASNDSGSRLSMYTPVAESPIDLDNLDKYRVIIG